MDLHSLWVFLNPFGREDFVLQSPYSQQQIAARLRPKVGSPSWWRSNLIRSEPYLGEVKENSFWFKVRHWWMDMPRWSGVRASGQLEPTTGAGTVVRLRIERRPFAFYIVAALWLISAMWVVNSFFYLPFEAAATVLRGFILQSPVAIIMMLFFDRLPPGDERRLREFVMEELDATVIDTVPRPVWS